MFTEKHWIKLPGFQLICEWSNESKFNSFLQTCFTVTCTNKINNSVQETIIKINEFNKIYKSDIIEDINKEKQENTTHGTSVEMMK